MLHSESQKTPWENTDPGKSLSESVSLPSPADAELLPISTSFLAAPMPRLPRSRRSITLWFHHATPPLWRRRAPLHLNWYYGTRCIPRSHRGAKMLYLHLYLSPCGASAEAVAEPACSIVVFPTMRCSRHHRRAHAPL